MNLRKPIKVVLMGSPKSGKTSLISTLLTGSPITPDRSVVFWSFCVDVHVDGTDYKVNLCEVSGPQELLRLHEATFLDADVLVVCSAVDDRTRLQSAEVFVGRCQRAMRPVMLCLTKADARRVVSREEARSFVEEHGLSGMVECTCKDEKTIRIALVKMVEQARKRIGRGIFCLCCSV